MRTKVYIDGFNLYYGSLQRSAYKWLDLDALFRNLLQPHHQILKIKYFTANVSPRAGNPDVHIRQQAYLSAIKSYTPHLEVHLGHFKSRVIPMPLANPTGANKFVDVIKTEEKGSDVNLAIHVLNDAWMDKYDCAVIVSHDSDLAGALKIVRQQLKKKIIYVPPGVPKTRRPVAELKQWSTATIKITEQALAASQLPTAIPNTSIRKPIAW